MKILLFGGTTEGRELSRILHERGEEVTVCVATAYGAEEQRRVPGVRTLVGPLSEEEKLALLREHDLCLDATHPYAAHITASVKSACEAAGVPCLRLSRPRSELARAAVLNSAAEAAAYLAGHQGNVLLATGANELHFFAALPPERLFPRILPSHASLSACEALGIPRRNIIAMQGPFSQKLNEALIAQFSIRFLVTKDGGREGGFPEKAAAAAASGVELLVLRRPEDAEISMDEILSLVEGVHRGGSLPGR